jgi:tetratricopeptide (TPR) repeat protein
MHTAKQTLLLQLKTKVVLACLAVFLIGVTAWLAYGWYTVNQGKKSQLILSECIDEYQKMFESKDAMWSEVFLMNELGHEQASSLKPYFLVMEAQALARQGKATEAVNLLEQVESAIAPGVPYKNYYHLTKALIQLDTQDVSLQQQGLSELQRLAHDEQNMFQDAALYYLAEYYAANDDLDKAQEERQLLLDGLNTIFKNSSWATKVKERFPVAV